MKDLRHDNSVKDSVLDIHLTIFLLETDEQVLWQTVKSQMKCRIGIETNVLNRNRGVVPKYLISV